MGLFLLEKKKKVEIFVIMLYNIDEIETFDLGEIETVKQSKMAVVEREGQTYLIYSKYQSDHSDIYAIPIVKEKHLNSTLDIYNFSNWDGSFTDSFINSGTEITNDDTRTLMTKFNLNPYNIQRKTENKSNNFYFRYLYTGREYNIETGNYYYRARIMDSGIGRFTSKDLICSKNLYYYVKNKTLKYKDISGKNPLDLSFWNISLDDIENILDSFIDIEKCNDYFKNNCSNGNNFENTINNMQQNIFWGFKNDVQNKYDQLKQKYGEQMEDSSAVQGFYDSNTNEIYLVYPDTGIFDRGIAETFVHELFHSCNNGQETIDNLNQGGDQELMENCLQ